ncbi:MAG: hypothetical protein FJW20_10865 [Acidimicrobiia bacterium]|nr:hypothetical protein [Acidimicrobiia bacterium]
MSIQFRDAALAPLEPVRAEVPDGTIIGVIGDQPDALSALARLAAGALRPSTGEVRAAPPARLVGPADPLNLAPAATLVLEHPLALQDAVVRARSSIGIERLRRHGASILIISHDQNLLASLCDEVWWLNGGRLETRGDPRITLDAYNRHVNSQLRQWAASISEPLAPSMRRGDGRAEIVSLETLDAGGNATVQWQSGEPVAVRVGVKFTQPVEDPVVGIMIRTRIGFEVFGTNTELERLKLGPVEGGARIAVTFRFPCGLCPQQYTLTAASHDPDGVWHDWLEDAVAFSVTDTRYTAGVANLRATAELERL